MEIIRLRPIERSVIGRTSALTIGEGNSKISRALNMIGPEILQASRMKVVEMSSWAMVCGTFPARSPLIRFLEWGVSPSLVKRFVFGGSVALTALGLSAATAAILMKLFYRDE